MKRPWEGSERVFSSADRQTGSERHFQNRYIDGSHGFDFGGISHVKVEFKIRLQWEFLSELQVSSIARTVEEDATRHKIIATSSTKSLKKFCQFGCRKMQCIISIIQQILNLLNVGYQNAQLQVYRQIGFLKWQHDHADSLFYRQCSDSELLRYPKINKFLTNIMDKQTYRCISKT